MNAYTIACTTVLMATGTLADRFGRKRIFIVSVMLFGLTSLICGLAQDVSVLIASRFLQGMSGGAMLICQVAVLSHQFQHGRERARAFSAWGIIFGVGLGFGPVIGGAIIAVADWQWVFLVHVAIAIVTLGLIGTGVSESSDPQAKRLDLPGIATLSVSVFCLALFITEGPNLGFASPVALGIAASSIASFLAFLFAEKINPRPMFDFSAFRIRNFSAALLGSAGMNFSFWPFMIYLPIYFHSALGYDNVTAGLALLAYTLPTLVAPPLGERLVLRHGPGIAIPLGLFTIGLGFMLMTLGSSADGASWLTMLPGCVLAGVGLGLTNTPVTNTTTGAVSSERAGMASGMDMSARLISLALNIALMGLILVWGIVSSLANALPGSIDGTQLRAIGEKIAAGDIVGLRPDFPVLGRLDPSGTVVHAALVHGFGAVMLYGGIGAWLLALASFLVAESRRPSRAAAACTPSTAPSSSACN